MRRKVTAIFLLGNFLFAAGVRDVIERNNSVIENQRKQEELERRQRELEKEDFGKDVKPVETDQVEESNVRFFNRSLGEFCHCDDRGTLELY